MVNYLSCCLSPCGESSQRREERGAKAVELPLAGTYSALMEVCAVSYVDQKSDPGKPELLLCPWHGAESCP